MIDEAIGMLRDGGTLGEEASYDAFAEIMRGGTDDERIKELLALLAARPVTVDELTGAARVMRERVTRVEVSEDVRATLVDTCGTGGAPKAFNVSTAAALIAAGAGRLPDARTPVRVAKHGNRSRTGRGSAEVLAELGVNADASPQVQARCLDEAGVCFCFAIHHHPAVKHAMPARRALGHPTIFNLLGPLTNPAGAPRQLIGCFDADALGVIARTLGRLGSASAMVVRGDDGLDEITTTTTTTVYSRCAGDVAERTIDAQELGVARATMRDLRADSVEESATIIRDVVRGETGPKSDIALVNASAALVVGGAAVDLASGLELAREAVKAGAAADALTDLVRVSTSA